jgi:predicted TIM-barrel fold metal-dependent hydrolase
LQWALFYGDRPIMDTFGSLILHNLFGRFPNIRVYSVENGSLWVPYLLAQMDKMKGMGNTGPWRGGRVEGRPSDVFKRHVAVSPFPEDNVPALIDLLGEDAVVMGSDYPHAEGTATPDRAAESVKDMGPTVLRKYMRDNALSLLAPAAVS